MTTTTHFFYGQLGLRSAIRVPVLLLLCLFWALAYTPSFAQGWEKIYGGQREDQSQALLHTPDQGFLLGGFSESFNAQGKTDAYLVRTDPDGKVLFSKTIDLGDSEHLYQLIPGLDGGYLAVGDVKTPDLGVNGLMVLFTETRDVKWSGSLGAIDFEPFTSVTPPKNGGYLILGRVQNNATQNENILLVKITHAGIREWTITLGDDRGDQAMDITEVANGYIVVGTQDNLNSAVGKNIAVYHITHDGIPVWTRIYGDTANEEGKSIITTRDGNIAIAGHANNFNEALVLKYNTQGTLLWEKRFGGALGDELNDLVELQDGSLVVTGHTESSVSDVNVLLAKLTPTGDLLWQRSIGSDGLIEIGAKLVSIPGQGFAIAGYNAPILSLFNDALLIKTDTEGFIRSNTIRGRVVHDKDGSCDDDASEPGIAGWMVKAEGREKSFFATTDSLGRYELTVDTGSYRVELLRPNEHWRSCVAGGYSVAMTRFYDTTTLAFPMRPNQVCSDMRVDVSTAILAPCNEVVYTVSYLNEGTAIATGAYIEVTLDPTLSYQSSTLPFSGKNGNTYTFPLGDIRSLQEGQFYITTTMACFGIAQDQATLVKAQAFPNSPCLLAGPGWDGSSIEVSGACVKDSIRFDIRNSGISNMSQELQFYIVRDVIVLVKEPFKLNSRETKTLQFRAEPGSTYRLIAQQAKSHPGRSNPTAAVEACVGNGTGVVTMFPENDGDNDLSIDVQQVTSTAEPVWLRASPKGYRDSLIAVDTDIKYQLTFYNPGQDTVRRVVIRDTLPEAFDLSSLQWGAASHPYTAEVYNERVLLLTFDNIQLLPMSGATITPQNIGFIQFRLSQDAGNSIGQRIENRASVTYDFQAPRQTNTVRHVVTDKLIPFLDVLSSVRQTKSGKDYILKITPNPLYDRALLQIQADIAPAKTFAFVLYNATGQQVQQHVFQGDQFEFTRQNLAAGLYTFAIKDSAGQIASTGKLVLR